jgi:acetyltransferase-like isoleucine patch superfamily enzyme
MTAGREHLAKTHKAVTGDQSALTRYQDVVVGHRHLLGLVYYEFCLWLAWVPGVLGLVLRRIFWPRLFRSCGKKVYFGSNVTLMHPHRIRLGDRIVIGNGCILDARNPASGEVIVLADDVILSHGVMLTCKNGRISIGKRCGIGAYTVIKSTRNPITLGDDVAIGPRCSIAGGGNYNTERLDVPIAQQGLRDMGDTVIGDGTWLGSNATVLGGVRTGRNSIVGAGAVVTRAIPDLAVCVGVPARVVRERGQ